VLLHGKDVVGLRPDEVVAAGIARTFQTIRLFPEMTVLENVLVGMHVQTDAGWLSAVLRTAGFQAEERRAEEEAVKLLGFFGEDLLARRYDLARNLSYANQRRLEVVRAMATGAGVLLLDEPAAGMNPKETAALMADIVRLKDLGRTILLIEHDMVVIATISDYVIALDHGLKIAEGSFDEVRACPQVIEAYLGRGAAGTAGDAVSRA
jgi:ABC-type branched-subunit amino acid transport system ATPase component